MCSTFNARPREPQILPHAPSRRRFYRQTRLKASLVSRAVTELTGARLADYFCAHTFLAAGKAAPLAFVWALAATLPTAISYVQLARRHPLSGSAASWVALAAPVPVAQWAGWMVFLYYLTNFIIQPVTLGVFAGELFGATGTAIGIGTYLFGANLCCAWPAWHVYRGISLSKRGALGFLPFECAVVLVLCGHIILAGGTALDFDGFRLASSSGGESGLFRAMIFGMLAFCGFDVISTLAEETKMAERLIPQATLLALVMYAALITFGVWCLSHSAEPEILRATAESGRMPISEIASRLWGKGALIAATWIGVAQMRKFTIIRRETTAPET